MAGTANDELVPVPDEFGQETSTSEEYVYQAKTLGEAMKRVLKSFGISEELYKDEGNLVHLVELLSLTSNESSNDELVDDNEEEPIVLTE